jgi:peptide/nickel transport system ATP-binding protein
MPTSGSVSISPGLIVADEPVSALDVSIQAQVLNTMRDLQDSLDLTYFFISHDLSVIRYLSDSIGVMYLGKLVEVGPAAQVYGSPLHPYTRALIDAVPLPDLRVERAKARTALKGELPSAADPPSGCRFLTRCPLAQEICSQQEPQLLKTLTGGHRVACHFPLTPAAPTSVTASFRATGRRCVNDVEARRLRRPVVSRRIRPARRRVRTSPRGPAWAGRCSYPFMGPAAEVCVDRV